MARDDADIGGRKTELGQDRIEPDGQDDLGQQEGAMASAVRPRVPQTLPRTSARASMVPKTTGERRRRQA